MDKYIDQDIGIYHVKYVCKNKDKDGHKLYHVKCNYCGFESDMRLYNIKTPKICKHKASGGHYIDFSAHWENKRLEQIFSGIKNRCFNTNDKSYCWYGEKVSQYVKNG